MLYLYKLILSHTTSAIIITYPCSDLNINSVAVPPNLIISLHRRLPCGNINDTPVYSRGKMLHWYILCAYGIVHDSEILMFLSNCAKICSSFLGAVTRIGILIMYLELTLWNTNTHHDNTNAEINFVKWHLSNSNYFICGGRRGLEVRFNPLTFSFCLLFITYNQCI